MQAGGGGFVSISVPVVRVCGFTQCLCLCLLFVGGELGRKLASRTFRVIARLKVSGQSLLNWTGVGGRLVLTSAASAARLRASFASPPDPGGDDPPSVRGGPPTFGFPAVGMEAVGAAGLGEA